MVFFTSDKPRTAKYSHSIGIITPFEAVNALTVNVPSDGEQSIKTTSYLSRTGASNFRSLCSLAISDTKAASAAAKSSWPLMKSSPDTEDFKMKSSSLESASFNKYQIDPYCSRRAAPLIPNPVVIEAWESKSISKTRRPVSARAAPKFIAVVVFPTPPF